MSYMYENVMSDVLLMREILAKNHTIMQLTKNVRQSLGFVMIEIHPTLSLQRVHEACYKFIKIRYSYDHIILKGLVSIKKHFVAIVRPSVRPSFVRPYPIIIGLVKKELHMKKKKKHPNSQ